MAGRDPQLEQLKADRQAAIEQGLEDQFSQSGIPEYYVGPPDEQPGEAGEIYRQGFPDAAVAARQGSREIDDYLQSDAYGVDPADYWSPDQQQLGPTVESLPTPQEEAEAAQYRQDLERQQHIGNAAATSEGLAHGAFQDQMAQSSYVGDMAEVTRREGKEVAAQIAVANAVRDRGLDEMEAFSTQMEEAFNSADRDLASMRVDPNKWEKETPTLSKVLLAVATGIHGFTSKGRGPNPIMGLIENAIDRDVDAQEKNIAIRAKRIKMGMEFKNRQAQVRSALHAAYYERALGAVEQVKYHAKNERTALNAQALEAELAAKAKLAMANYYGESVKAATAPVGKPLKAGDVEKQISNVAVIERGANILERVRKLTESGEGLGRISASKIGQLLGLKGGGEIDQIKAFARQMGRALGTDKGNFAEKEGEVMVRAMLEGRWDRAAAAVANLERDLTILGRNYSDFYEGMSQTNDVRAMDPSKKRLTKIMRSVLKK